MRFIKILIYIITFGNCCGDLFLSRKLAKKSSIFKYHYAIFLKTKCADIPLSCVVPESTIFPHDIYGCFFSINAIVGNNCTIFHHVTIGSNYEKKFIKDCKGKLWGAPIIENNVFIGAGAKIIGPVRIGAGAKIGAGCIVTKDVPPGATCVMQNSRIIIK